MMKKDVKAEELRVKRSPHLQLPVKGSAADHLTSLLRIELIDWLSI